MQVMRKKKAEIDAVLAQVIRQDRASESLYRCCFPDRLLVQRLRARRERAKRLEQVTKKKK